MEKGKKRYFHSKNLPKPVKENYFVGLWYADSNYMLAMIDDFCEKYGLKVSYCKTRLSSSYCNSTYVFFEPVN